jgi:DedD protein
MEKAMEEGLKQRLIGAAVLVGAGVVFIPMLLDNSGVSRPMIEGSNIPPRPTGEFSSQIMALNREPLEVQRPKLAVPPERPRELGSDGTVRSVEPTDRLAEAQDSPPGSDQRIKRADGRISSLGSPPANKRAGVMAWAIQLGSFTSEENAMAFQVRLRKRGYRAFVEKIYIKSGRVFRVRVGPELLHSEAKRLQASLEKDLKLKGIMVRYP